VTAAGPALPADGFGDPRARDPRRARDDVLDGMITAEEARRDYGVVRSRNSTWPRLSARGLAIEPRRRCACLFGPTFGPMLDRYRASQAAAMPLRAAAHGRTAHRRSRRTTGDST
jgi:N-methylhydantoinase B